MSSPILGLGPAVTGAHDTAKSAYLKEKSRLTKASQDFEALFVGMMLKQMRKSMAGENALFGKSSESKIYQDMMDDKLAEQMSHTGTFGLAKAMMKSVEGRLPADPDAPRSAKKP